MELRHHGNGYNQWSTPRIGHWSGVISNLYINDLEDSVTNWILKFADDTKSLVK